MKARRSPVAHAEERAGILFDQGFRRHVLDTYNYMGLGLAITGLVVLLVAGTPAIHQPIFGSPLKWLAIFAPLGFVLFLSFRIERMTTASARMFFHAFLAMMGISLASIFSTRELASPASSSSRRRWSLASACGATPPKRHPAVVRACAAFAG